jgi:hypothetical protein
MKEQQRVNLELAWVVRWRETGEEPTEGELFIGDSRSKYYWINREVFVLEKGVLWREEVHPLLFLHFVLTWALKTNALRLSNYLDSLETFPSKSISRFPCRDPDPSHPRSHFFFLLILTITHGLTLTWLMNFKEPQGQLVRWLEELSQFNMEIQHTPGKKHTTADALSRIPGGNHVQISI